MPYFLFEVYDDYIELFIYSFFGKNPSECVNRCINNMEVLEKFKFYFKDKAHKLLEQSKKHKIFVPKEMQLTIKGSNKENEDKHINKAIFLKEIDSKCYMLNGDYENKWITKREIDVIKFLASGHSVKGAAKLIGISSRTVEGYIDNVKDRLDLQ